MRRSPPADQLCPEPPKQLLRLRICAGKRSIFELHHATRPEKSGLQAADAHDDDAEAGNAVDADKFQMDPLPTRAITTSFSRWRGRKRRSSAIASASGTTPRRKPSFMTSASASSTRRKFRAMLGDRMRARSRKPSAPNAGMAKSSNATSASRRSTPRAAILLDT